MTSDEWHCICGSGDDGEWHSLLCVSNTPDEHFYGTPTTTADPTTEPRLPTELPLPTTEETLP